MKKRIKKCLCLFFTALVITISFTSIVAQASVTTGKFVPFCGVGVVYGKCVSQTQAKGGQTLYATCTGGDLYDMAGNNKGQKYVETTASHSKIKCENTYSSMDTTDYLTGNKIASLSAGKNESFGWDMECMLNNKQAPYTRKVSVFGCSESHWNGYSYVLYPTPINV